MHIIPTKKMREVGRGGGAQQVAVQQVSHWVSDPIAGQLRACDDSPQQPPETKRGSGGSMIFGLEIEFTSGKIFLWLI